MTLFFGLCLILRAFKMTAYQVPLLLEMQHKLSSLRRLHYVLKPEGKHDL